MPDPRTIATYDEKAEDYARRFTKGEPDAHLRDFIALIPANGRVLDVGCGPGTASAHMLRAGLRPDPMDASAKMVQIANRTTGLNARQATFDEIAGTALYEGVWANFSLLHAPRADLPRHIKACVQAMVPGGVFHIGMKTGSGERRDNIYRLYTFVTVPELTDMLEAAGLTVTDTFQGQDAGLAGTVDPWVVMRAKKPDA